ncbi:MAG: hypothetical protein OXP69_14325 [Spirochaetaceae bacterium]|nr:hypothetical protein [Spirochaetaceae bacterium]
MLGVAHPPPPPPRFFASRFATRLARGWLATAYLLSLALSLATGTAAAEGTLPTVSVSDAHAYGVALSDSAATLTESDIEDTTATLTIAGHTDARWYKENAPSRIGRG